MAEQRELSDRQILSKLRRRKSPATAQDLGLPSRGGAARLRGLDGVVEVGREHTGKAGRPAALFTVAERVPDPSPDHAGPAVDASGGARDGSLSEQVVNQ